MKSSEPTTELHTAPDLADAGSRSGQRLLLLLLAGFVVLCGRLVLIHAREGPRLTAYAARQQRSTLPIPARRGLIVDARGRLLAGTRLRQSVFADPKIIADKKQAGRQVAAVLGCAPEEVETDLIAAEDRRFFVLARGITDEQAERLRAADLHGIGLFEEPYRAYPMGSVAAALLGFVAADGHGVSGLEHQFDAWLAGRAGFKSVVRDARRRAFWLAGSGYQPPRDGLNLVLTIDAVIQENVEQALADVVQQYEAESALSVVMRPTNGDVLAMATHPGFEPERFGDFAPPRYRNRVITDPMEPGSIFKPFVAAAALAERVTSLDDVIDCHRGLLVDGARRLHDHHPYGDLSFRDVVVKSSNIGMALIGKRLGNRRMHEYLERFGFGRTTGCDLEGEDPGILLALHRWNSFSTTSLPMGHEIAATPLQMARAFCALANGGKLVRPRVVRAILRGEDEIVREFPGDESPPRVLPESVARTLKNEILVDVVRRGTGVNAQIDGYQVFGKTGTAQIPRKGAAGYEPRAYLSSFVGGAPASAPQLVVLVSVTRPKAEKGYYGGTVAAPVAARILEHALAYLNVPPDGVVLAESSPPPEPRGPRH